VPGTWLAAVFSLGFIGAALVMLLRDAAPSVPMQKMSGLSLDNFQLALVQVLGCAVLGILVPLWATRYLLPHLPSAVSPMLAQGLGDALSPQEEQTIPLHVGDCGVTITLLKPTGRARFGAQTLEVQSRDEFMEAGTPVRVVAMDGHRIVVARGDV